VLDIGGATGALIVHTDPSVHGLEAEISLAAEDDRRSHEDVLEREIDGHPAYGGDVRREHAAADSFGDPLRRHDALERTERAAARATLKDGRSLATA
jgi:hypothetical protein